MSDGDSDSGIKVIPEGPLRVTGAELCRLGIEFDEHDRPVAYSEHGDVEHAESYSLCRCGASANKPFCDGTHRSIDWDPAETASRTPSADRRRTVEGKGIAMTDDKGLCWHAGFCARDHGHAWDLVKTAESSEQVEEVKSMIQACPSSRLQFHEPTGSAPVEPELPQRIAILDDGPLYVQGGIPVEGADGAKYETLNRVSLCRCGASKNKPYCDSTHTKIGFCDPE